MKRQWENKLCKYQKAECSGQKQGPLNVCLPLTPMSQSNYSDTWKLCPWCILGLPYYTHRSPSHGIHISHLKRKREHSHEDISYPAPWCFPISWLPFNPTTITLLSGNLCPAQQSEWHELWKVVLTFLLEAILKLFPRGWLKFLFWRRERTKSKFLYKANTEMKWISLFVLVDSSCGISLIAFIFHGDCQMKWKLA